MGLLIWSCIIWVVVFDPNQFAYWLKIAIYLGCITWIWWWICGFGNPFKSDKENEEV
jgi:hypothetical protein